MLILITLISGGIFLYQSQEKAMQERVANNLAAIAGLKAEQITDWRRDNLKDASLFSAFLRLSVPRFLADPSEENRRDNLFRFQSIADQHDYDDIILVSLGGKPVFLDLHKEPTYLSIHTIIVAPLFGVEGPDAAVIGALVLVTDASKFLYPLIQSWPTAEKTAETFLVRHDNDHVLFLNDLRHRPDSALNLGTPLTQHDVVAVMAVEVKQGYIEGKDYRGEDVSGVILPIPESPWFIIANVDRKEAFSEWHVRSLLISFLMLGLMFLLWTVTLVFRQREKKIEFQKRYESESVLKQTLESHSTTLKAIGDAVISTDAGGLVTLMNPVAESLTGHKQEESLGKPLEKVFCIINAGNREKAVNPVEGGLKDGLTGVIAGHTILISKDGKEYRISDFAVPIKHSDGRLIGVVLVFRDFSHAIEVEEKLSQAQRMASIGTLAGGIAHDFNNILFPLIGHTEMLLEDLPEDGPIRDSLNQIYSSSLRARDLVKQIFPFARQEKNEMKLMKMQPIVKETMKLIRSTIPATIFMPQ